MARKKNQTSESESRLRRITREILRIGLMIALLGALGYAVYDLVVYLDESETFVVRDVKVKGNHLLEEGEIIESLGLPSVVYIWQVDPKLLENRLLSLDLVRSATVKRVLPQTISVEVIERTPLVSWTDSQTGQTYVVDEEAILIGEIADINKRLQLNQGEQDWVGERPQVTGAKGWGWLPGDRLDIPELGELLQAIGFGIARHETWLAGLKEIHFGEEGMGWVLKGVEPLSEVRLGTCCFSDRLARLEPVWKFLKQEALQVAYIDLRFEQQGILIQPLNCTPQQWIELATRYPGLQDCG